jgi:glucans biosynthesis protein
MFWFGENSGTSFGDFRPEVHDSDGLLVATPDGRRLWRPLNNPSETVVTEYESEGGFGLFQRDRAFSSYQDLEARAELRPSVWIEPGEGWPDGHVRLVELSTVNEYADNIVAMWVPSRTSQPGDRLDFNYRLRWTNSIGFDDADGWVSATRQTQKVSDRAERTMYVVDFSFREFGGIPEDAALSPEISVPDHVEIIHQEVIRNEINETVRLSFLLEAVEGNSPVDVRARILLEGVPIAETWTTRWKQ